MFNRKRRARRARVVTSAILAPGLLASVLAGPATALPTVGVPTFEVGIQYLNGVPAPGAVVELITGELVGLPTRIDKAIADAKGMVEINPSETDELIRQAREGGDRLRAVLVAEAKKVLENGETEVFKVVQTLWLTLGEVAGDPTFLVDDPPNVKYVHPMPVFETTFLQQLGEKTIDMVGQRLDEGDARVKPAIELLKRELAAMGEDTARYGWLNDNEWVAYAVPMADGVFIWITRTPENFVVRTDGDLGTYEVIPITSPGLPVPDTTDAGDAIEDVTAPLGTNTAKEERGGWEKVSHDCFYVNGPTDNPGRYHRTVCWSVNHQVLDTYKGRSYWQYHERTSGSALNGNKMKKLWVQTEPVYSGAGSQYRDGIAEPSETLSGQENCETHTKELYVESGEPVKIGARWRWSRVNCETYTPKMLPNSGQHASIWYGNPDVKSDVYRSVGATVPVFTATAGASPRWSPWSGQHVD